MTHPVDGPERRHQDPFDRPGCCPEKRHGEGRNHDAEGRHPEQAGLRIVAARANTRENLVKRITDCSAQRQNRCPVHHPHARPDDDQHAGEPDKDRHPAADADLFLEHRDRQRGHQQRPHETDRDGIGQRQITQRGKKQGRRRQHQGRPGDMKTGPRGSRQPEDIDPRKDGVGHQRMKDIARPDDLGDVVITGQRLDDRLADRKQRNGNHQQPDAKPDILGSFYLVHKTI